MISTFFVCLLFPRTTCLFLPCFTNLTAFLIDFNFWTSYLIWSPLKHILFIGDIQVTPQIKIIITSSTDFYFLIDMFYFGPTLLVFVALTVFFLPPSLFRPHAHLVAEEMRAAIYPAPLPFLEAKTRTNIADEKTGLKRQKADRMETTESWWEIWFVFKKRVLRWHDSNLYVYSQVQSSSQTRTGFVFLLRFKPKSYFMLQRLGGALIVILKECKWTGGLVKFSNQAAVASSFLLCPVEITPLGT